MTDAEREIAAARLVEISELLQQLAITEKLLAERELVLKAIPACPDHGDQCVPHALEWIEKARLQLAELEESKELLRRWINIAMGMEEVQDRLRAQLKEGSKLLAEVIEDDCRNIHITEAAALWLSQIEKEQG